MGSFLGKGQQQAAGSRSYSRSQPGCSDQGYCLPEDSQDNSLLETKLPDELLAQVFEHLLPADLIKGPARVSQRWQRCSLQPFVWKNKLDLSGVELEKLGCTQRWALPQLYSVLSASNLLAAPDAPNTSTRREWSGKWFTTPGSRWQPEDQGGNGMNNTVPKEIYLNDLVLASTYTTCGVSTVVDLQEAFVRAGLGSETAEVVLHKQPALHFSIWGGQRFDCGAEGAIMVAFGRTADEARAAVSGHQDNMRLMNVSLSEVERSWNEDHVARMGLQGEHDKWKKYVCIIDALPAGTRYVGVTVQGKDTQFWSGHYGMKFAKPCLTWSLADHSADHCKCSAERKQAVFGGAGVTISTWPHHAA